MTVFSWSPDTAIMPDFPITLPLALGLCKSRSADVQLAACLW